MATDRQLSHEQVWARPGPPRLLRLSPLTRLRPWVRTPFREAVSHSVVWGPQMLPLAVCRRSCGARMLQGQGLGEAARRAGRVAPRTPGLQGQHPGASEVFPGQVGLQGHTADTRPPSRESATRYGRATVANRLLFEHPGSPLPRASAPAQWVSKRGPVLLDPQFPAPLQTL